MTDIARRQAVKLAVAPQNRFNAPIVNYVRLSKQAGLAG